jgi:hypothetical protein
MSEELELVKELVKLRIGVARVAQAIGIADIDSPFPVEDLAYEQLWDLAHDQQRGWNRLCELIADEAQRLQQYRDFT